MLAISLPLYKVIVGLFGGINYHVLFTQLHYCLASVQLPVVSRQHVESLLQGDSDKYFM